MVEERTGRRSGEAREQSGAESDERRGPRGGFREQPVALKVLLALSLIAVAAGVVRCSFELTTPPAPVETVGVVLSRSSALPDSLQTMLAARFAERLEELEEMDVSVVEEGETGFDALAVVRPTVEDGVLTVQVEVSDARSRRYLGAAQSTGPPRMAADIARLAAERAAPVLRPREADEE